VGTLVLLDARLRTAVRRAQLRSTAASRLFPWRETGLPSKAEFCGAAQNRTRNAAIFASFSRRPLTTIIARRCAPAADECLSGPKARRLKAAMYYRVDRASKRHAETSEERPKSFLGAAPQNRFDGKTPFATETDGYAAVDRSCAPELPVPQTRVEQETSVPTWQWSPAITRTRRALRIANPRTHGMRHATIGRHFALARVVRREFVASPHDDRQFGPALQSNSAARTTRSRRGHFPPQPTRIRKTVRLAPDAVDSDDGAWPLPGSWEAPIFQVRQHAHSGRRPARGVGARSGIRDTDRPPPLAYPRADVPRRSADGPASCVSE